MEGQRGCKEFRGLEEKLKTRYKDIFKNELEPCITMNMLSQKLVVKEGDDAQFSCTVEAGNPAPEVRRINVLFVI